MKLMDRIRKLFGVRSPTLEQCGYYTCKNCTHHTSDLFVLSTDEDGYDKEFTYCRKKGLFVKNYDTCKYAKPIVIKPLTKKWRWGRGTRAKFVWIDEIHDYDDGDLYKAVVEAASKIGSDKETNDGK